LNHTRAGKTYFEKLILESRGRNGGVGATPESEWCDGSP